MESVSDFAYLWDAAEDGWVVWRDGDPTTDCIFNVDSKMALVIEDEGLCRAVIARMLAEQVSMITAYPG